MINNDWDELLGAEFAKPYFLKLVEDIKEEYLQHTCYPPINQVFNAFRLTPYKDVKVLLLGQDPYPNPNQAMGLAFSVNDGIALPKSLINIYMELSSDLQIKTPASGNLTGWARNGVLLLNAILSVRQGEPLSHQKYDWTTFTDEVIKLLNQKTTPIVFVLWGNYARSKKQLITNPIHLVIENVHPSPLSASRGFFGARPFSKINDFLRSTNQEPIDFSLNQVKQ
ncbi:MAG: uracil-DNA glycosylase [Bacilli bacterium]|nr:uracil-DNA glycosylase [Bacilli bacterium]MBN2696243.1 uracil-DNA glycosylase [Bacilli bacterium]